MVFIYVIFSIIKKTLYHRFELRSIGFIKQTSNMETNMWPRMEAMRSIVSDIVAATSISLCSAKLVQKVFGSGECAKMIQCFDQEIKSTLQQMQQCIALDLSIGKGVLTSPSMLSLVELCSKQQIITLTKVSLRLVDVCGPDSNGIDQSFALAEKVTDVLLAQMKPLLTSSFGEFISACAQKDATKALTTLHSKSMKQFEELGLDFTALLKVFSNSHLVSDAPCTFDDNGKQSKARCSSNHMFEFLRFMSVYWNCMCSWVVCSLLFIYYLFLI